MTLVCQSKLINKIVVVGSPRSGTTVCSNFISSAENCTPPIPECSYITGLIESFRNICLFSDAPRFSAYAISQENLANNYKLLVDELIENAASQILLSSHDTMVLKDPVLTKYVDWIHEFFGLNTKIVWVVRNPVDIIASQMLVYDKKHQINNFLKRKRYFRDVCDSVFNDYYSVSNSGVIHSPNFHVLDYKKLIRRDRMTISSLQDFLGLVFESANSKENPFGYDEKDPTFTEGYRGDFVENNPVYKLRWYEERFVKRAFAGYINKYQLF